MPLIRRSSFHNEARRSSVHLSRLSDLDDLLDSDYEGSVNTDNGFNRNGSDAFSGKSMISSLEDVCLPLNDSQDSNPVVDEHGNKVWPDLKSLQEFSNQELEELAEVHPSEESNTNSYMIGFANRTTASRNKNNSYDEDDEDDYTTDQTESDVDHPNIAFKSPIVTKVDVISRNITDYQQLLSHKVNEADGLNGRLRAPRIYPWNNNAVLDNKNNNIYSSNIAQKHKFIQPIVSKDHLLDEFRFAYFREDLDTTIHSPNISGILQPGQTFADLFVSSVYSKNQPSIRKSWSPFNSAEPSNSSVVSKKNEKHIFWLDVLNPTEDEIKVIAKSFGLHSLTAEDILLGESREKVEVFNNYYFICFRSFDVVHEKLKIRVKRALDVIDDSDDSDDENYFYYENGKLLTANQALSKRVYHFFTNIIRKIKGVGYSRRKLGVSKKEVTDLLMRHNKRYSSDSRFNELQPLNIYIVVFKEGVLTFHFNSTPHPVNVRRRCRLLRDYLNVSSDWIAYALIDDITDAFFPMIELLESEVHSIEDEIIKMQTKNSDDESDDSDSDSSSDDDLDYYEENTGMSNSYHSNKKPGNHNSLSNIKKRLLRRTSTAGTFSNINKSYAPSSSSSSSSGSSSDISSSSSDSSALSMASNATLQWQKKNDMLRQIGECRKKVMILLRLLGYKADVIKGFSKRFGNSPSSLNYSRANLVNTNTVTEDAYDIENTSNFDHRKVNPTAISHENSELGMYLGDIQDHVITMVQTLNHCEKLLSRAHSNYLAQINIDMTKVNNDMNDVLGKLTILGTIVLPMNVVTGLWGMNVEVPGQFQESLMWFTSITSGLIIFGVLLFFVAKRIGVA